MMTRHSVRRFSVRRFSVRRFSVRRFSVRRFSVRRRALLLGAPLALLLAAVPARPAAAGGYQVTNLVANTPGVAAYTDPNLINPWGISYGPTGPFWVSNNGTATSTLYNGSGAPQALVVTTPAGAAPGAVSAPTGQVFNGSSDFGGNRFLFASEDGVLSAWKGSDGTLATIAVDNSTKGRVYTGIAISGHNLYAANIAGGGLDVFDSGFQPVATITDSDANGSSPFNVQSIAGTLYVTYTGAGGDFLDSLDPVTGKFTRLATGGALHGAWGLALAPATFGKFGGDLLVGNFGDGAINAYSAAGAFQGAVTGPDGKPLVLGGLWGLTFGNGGSGGSPYSLYFAAGGADETSGLFGRIDPAAPVPEASTTLSLGLLLVLGLGSLTITPRRKAAASKPSSLPAPPRAISKGENV